MKRTLLTIACLLASVSFASAQGADIAGKWEVMIEGPQGATPAPLELRKEGDKFVGVFYTPQGNADVTATVKDKAVTFVLPPFQTQNGPIEVTMNGTLEGETMKGTIDAAGRATFDWTAKRTPPAGAAAGAPAAQAEAKQDVTGTWALEVTTAAGSGTPSVVLKQDGEKLSGQYTGQLGEGPVTGTVKGADVTFSLTITVQGTTATIVYAGTVEKDTMKGTVTLGEMGEGTFVGKKK